MAKPIKQRILKPGVVIAGKYRIEKPVARGGFSVIYRAVHVDMDREVGLKILQLGDNIRANWLERFSREARLASQLTHQNTVTIFDYGQDERGFLYLAMEWIEGESLYQIFEKRGALDPVEVAQIARQILASLDEAHRRGILHRDLKPSNIMLTQNYEGKKTVKVLDFGIAKIFEGQTPSGTKITREGGFVGTPRYASPEQLDGKGLTPAADIYPVGLLMWEGLVGDPAVPGIEYGECAQYHASPEPWHLPEASAVPSELARIVHKALQKEPDERYSSARSMHDDLAAWIQSDEAREAGFGQIGGGGFFEPDSSLAEISSDPVDEPGDDLFADLASGVPSDDVPLDLEGPSKSETSGPPPFDKDRMEQGTPDPPPGPGSTSIPRPDQLEPTRTDEVASEAGPPRPGRSTEDTAPQATKPDVSDQRETGVARNVESRRRPRTEQLRGFGDAEDGDKKTQKIVVGVAVGAIAIAAVIAIVQLVIGDDQGATQNVEDVSTSSSEEPPAEPSETGAPDEKAPGDEEVEDNSKTVSVDALLLAIRKSGWRQEGEITEIDLDDGSQHSALFRAGGNSVAITIFAADNRAIARDIVRNTSAEQRVVRFGENVVRMRPASGPGKKRATKRMATMLGQFKAETAK
jgi:serine/threonine-protein kinase